MNARHTRWNKGTKTTRGGKVVMKLLRARPMDKPLFQLRVPAGSTHFDVTSSGAKASSCLDIFLVSSSRGDWASRAVVMDVLGVGCSDHVPISITLRSKLQVGRKAEVVFLPAVRRLLGERVEQVRKEYKGTLPPIADKFNEVGSVQAFTECVRRGRERSTASSW